MVVTIKPKPMVENANTLSDTVAKANTIERAKENVIITKQEVKEKVEELKSKAPKLINDLGGSYEDRINQPRSITLHMDGSTRSQVTLTGYWDGRLIQGAMNAIAKQYRQRRITATKM